MTKFRLASILVVSITFIGCASSVSSGYGPRGGALIGGAYGYSDKKITDDSWMIDYVGADATEAKQGAKKRAAELCKSKGFAGTKFNVELGVNDGLVVARGLADCLTPSQMAKDGGQSKAQRLIARVKEIDVEIAAYEDEIAATKKPSPLVGGAGIFGGLVDSFASSNFSSKIAGLKSERFGIMTKLKQMASK